METNKPKLLLQATGEEAASIAKPEGFSLDKFKSTRAPAMANVETLPNAAPVPLPDKHNLHPRTPKTTLGVS
jgi:hypothetical protein